MSEKISDDGKVLPGLSGSIFIVIIAGFVVIGLMAVITVAVAGMDSFCKTPAICCFNAPGIVFPGVYYYDYCHCD